MIDILNSLQAWHWMLLGIILLGIEALHVRGYLAGAGTAAFVTCFVALSDAPWQVQIGVYLFLAVFFTIIYFKKVRHKLSKQIALMQSRVITEASRAHPLVGKVLKVVESNKGKAAKVNADGKTWEVQCKQGLDVNDEVRVRSCKGKILHVSKLV